MLTNRNIAHFPLLYFRSFVDISKLQSTRILTSPRGFYAIGSRLDRGLTRRNKRRMRRAFSWRWVTRLNRGTQAKEECRSVSSDRSINSGLLRVYGLEVPGITVGGIIIMLLLAICTRRCCSGYLFVNRWK